MARIDSIHEAGDPEAFREAARPFSEDQRRHALALGIAWGLRKQRERGYWLSANDSARAAERAASGP